MTLTIKNADLELYEALQKLFRLMPQTYEIEEEGVFNEEAYAKEVARRVEEVESGRMKTYTLEESKVITDKKIAEIKAKYAD